MGQDGYSYKFPTCHRVNCLKLGTNIKIMSSETLHPHICLPQPMLKYPRFRQIFMQPRSHLTQTPTMHCISVTIANAEPVSSPITSLGRHSPSRSSCLPHFFHDAQLVSYLCSIFVCLCVLLMFALIDIIQQGHRNHRLTQYFLPFTICH
jgi:hypothetical protein